MLLARQYDITSALLTHYCHLSFPWFWDSAKFASKSSHFLTECSVDVGVDFAGDLNDFFQCPIHDFLGGWICFLLNLLQEQFITG